MVKLQVKDTHDCSLTVLSILVPINEKTLNYIFWRDSRHPDTLQALRMLHPLFIYAVSESIILDFSSTRWHHNTGKKEVGSGAIGVLTSQWLQGMWAHIIPGLIITSREEKAWEERRQGPAFFLIHIYIYSPSTAVFLIRISQPT